jgi:uncharacterized linocin/CFP29 family protein
MLWVKASSEKGTSLHLKAQHNPPLKLLERHKIITTPITIAEAIVVPSQPLHFHLEISLGNNKFYTSPFKKWTASPQHYTVIVFKKGTSSIPPDKA